VSAKRSASARFFPNAGTVIQIVLQNSERPPNSQFEEPAQGWGQRTLASTYGLRNNLARNQSLGRADPQENVMGTDSPSEQPGVPATVSAIPRRFSKTVTVSYVAMGLFSFIFVSIAVLDLWQAVTSGSPLFIVVSIVSLFLGLGLIGVMLTLHDRRYWSRYFAVLFWLLCLIGSSVTIVRNGSHPQPPDGPLKYSNEAQVAGARFGALVIPYFMVVLELGAIYGLLVKPSVVNQFKQRNE
jgi:hypothetical protein